MTVLSPPAAQPASGTTAPEAPVRLNVGCGRHRMPGWIGLDIAPGPGVDVVFDLERCAAERLPFADDSVDEVQASHVLEHIRNLLPLMQELWRVARPGAELLVRVPYGSSDDAWEDPTHVRAFFLGSFGYYGQPYYWKADYGYGGDWRAERIHLRVRGCAGMAAAAIMDRVRTERNVVAEMACLLTAVKPARAPRQELFVPPQITVETV